MAHGGKCIALVAAIALVACSDPRPATQVIVIFDGDPIVRRVAQEIEIVVRGGDSGSTEVPGENEQFLRFDLDSIGGWPVTHTIIPEAGDPGRLYLIEGRVYSAADRDVPVGTARAISGYIEGRTLILRIHFYGVCLYREPCAEPDETCGAEGECVDAWYPAGALPEYVPGTDGGVPDAPIGACVTDIDCDDLVGCTVDMCESGTCVRIPDVTLCVPGPDVRCDPDTGCQYGMGCDAATCASTLCEAAQCVDNVCMRVPVCQPGQTCCEGICNGCQSDECSDASCDVASDTCQRTPRPGALCDDGVYCNGADSCGSAGTCTEHAGDPCGGAMCVEAGLTCANCTSDMQCPTAPTGPWSTCAPVDAAPCQIAGTETRPIETRSCMTGDCVASGTSFETRSCTVGGVDGNICAMGSPMCSGPCIPRGGCTTEGYQNGTVSITRCMGGSCSSVTTGTTECDCTVPLDPMCIDGGTPTDGGSEAGMDGGICPGGPVEVACHDFADNDCDGDYDCWDGDCIGAGTEICTDGIDNDCDGNFDCADSACSALPVCGMDAGACLPVPETTPRCGNGIDDDCDGFTDCADVPGCCAHSSCIGRPPCPTDGGSIRDSGPSIRDAATPLGDSSISLN